MIRNLAADTKRLLHSITAKNIHKLQCYLILALIPTFNRSSFNSLIELRTASILIFTGTLIPPPTRHLPFGSSKSLPITLLQLAWSLWGVKKSLGHAQISFRTFRTFRGLIQNFQRPSPPLSYAESPPTPGINVGSIWGKPIYEKWDMPIIVLIEKIKPLILDHMAEVTWPC